MTVTPDDSDRRRDRRGVWLALAGVTALLGALYLAGHFVLADRLPVGARVAGVGVGTMTVDDARAKLHDKLEPRVDDPIRLFYGQREFDVDPKKAGLTLDLDQTLRNAGASGTWNPVRMVQAVAGSGNVQPALEVDGESLRAVVARIAKAVDDPAVEPRITFVNGKPKVRKARDGLVVNRDATGELIRHSYLRDEDAGRVPTRNAEPTVTAKRVKRALSNYARPAVSGPVKLAVGKRAVKLGVNVFAPALVLRPVDGELEPALDPKRLAGPLQRATKNIRRQARDATVRLVKGKPRVVPARPGIEIDPPAVAKALIPALAKTGSGRRVAFDARKVQADFTTKEAKALGITERVSSYTTHFPPAHYRNVNQARAAKLIDGTVLRPGETFSFNDTVGERTTARGFVAGKGSRRDANGVDQVATTLYNAAFFAGMKDVEHTPHRSYLRRYPAGRDATVAWRSVDLRFADDTAHGVLIHAWLDRSSPGKRGAMHVRMWSTKTYRVAATSSARRNVRSPSVRYDPSDRCTARPGVPGFDIEVYRILRKGGEQTRRETTTTHYDPADTVRCHAKPKHRR